MVVTRKGPNVGVQVQVTEEPPSGVRAVEPMAPATRSRSTYLDQVAEKFFRIALTNENASDRVKMAKDLYDNWGGEVQIACTRVIAPLSDEHMQWVLERIVGVIGGTNQSVANQRETLERNIREMNRYAPQPTVRPIAVSLSDFHELPLDVQELIALQAAGIVAAKLTPADVNWTGIQLPTVTAEQVIAKAAENAPKPTAIQVAVEAATTAPKPTAGQVADSSARILYNGAELPKVTETALVAKAAETAVKGLELEAIVAGTSLEDKIIAGVLERLGKVDGARVAIGVVSKVLAETIGSLPVDADPVIKATLERYALVITNNGVEGIAQLLVAGATTGARVQRLEARLGVIEELLGEAFGKTPKEGAAIVGEARRERVIETVCDALLSDEAEVVANLEAIFAESPNSTLGALRLLEDGQAIRTKLATDAGLDLEDVLRDHAAVQARIDAGTTTLNEADTSKVYAQGKYINAQIERIMEVAKSFLEDHKPKVDETAGV